MTPPEPCKIIELRAENIKKLTAVHLKPDGQSVVIGGNNDEGKSSVLDSILYALGGERAICDEPLRRGQKKGEVTLDLGHLVITRRFTEGGGTSLVVKAKDGAVQPSPQKILDQLVGKLTFDPLAFMAMDPKPQRECLAQLAGLDFAPITAEYDRLYAERTEANREAARLQALWTAKTFVPGVPEKEVSVTDLMAKLSDAQAANRKMENAEGYVGDCEGDLATVREAIASKHDLIKDLTAKLDQEKQKLADLENNEKNAIHNLEQASAHVATLTKADEQPIKDAIAKADSTNAAIRSNAEYKRLKSEHSKAATLAAHVDHDCKATLDKKQKMVEDAQFPLPDLSVSDDAVLFAGIPLKQASSSQQIQVSAAIGIALNPRLRVMFIREGSLLDLNSLQALQAMAQAHDVQLWIERVSQGDEVSVIIEDGAVLKSKI